MNAEVFLKLFHHKESFYHNLFFNCNYKNMSDAVEAEFIRLFPSKESVILLLCFSFWSFVDMQKFHLMKTEFSLDFETIMQVSYFVNFSYKEILSIVGFNSYFLFQKNVLKLVPSSKVCCIFKKIIETKIEEDALELNKDLKSLLIKLKKSEEEFRVR